MPIAGRHGIRVLIDEARAHLDQPTQIVAQTNSMSLQKALVRGGHGWTILPAVGIADELLHGTLTGAPIRGLGIPRTVVLAHPRAGQTTAAVQAVSAELARLIQDQLRSGAWLSGRLLDGPRARAAAHPTA